MVVAVETMHACCTNTVVRDSDSLATQHCTRSKDDNDIGDTAIDHLADALEYVRRQYETYFKKRTDGRWAGFLLKLEKEKRRKKRQTLERLILSFHQ